MRIREHRFDGFQMAPGDLLGIVVRRFIGRSLGTVHTSANKEPPIVLFHALPRINQVIFHYDRLFLHVSVSVKT